MPSLRELARGQECEIRAPGICCGNPETVVLCHIKLPGVTGIGMKSPDALAAYGCQPCHDFVDGRADKDAPLDYRRTLLLEGMARTQYKLIQRGVLKW
jgi:hypothetical protein